MIAVNFHPNPTPFTPKREPATAVNHHTNADEEEG
jgi:hypothetical protein